MLPVSGADIDIRDCLASYSYVFGLVQRTRPNKLCLADKAQAAGKIEEAAKLRCSYYSVRRAFGGREACVTAMSLESVPEPVPQPAATDEDEEGDEQAELLADLQASVQNLQDELSKKPKATKIIVKETPPEVQQQIDEDALRRANARKALRGEK